MTPYLRAFEPSDAVEILNRDGRQGSTWNIIRQAQKGPAFTAVLDGRPIGCGGIWIPWPGVGMGWMVLSEAIAPHWRWMAKTTKQLLRVFVRVHALHRVEASALEESPVNQRWLEWLGFTRERDGVARQYLIDKRSMVRYEWIGD